MKTILTWRVFEDLGAVKSQIDVMEKAAVLMMEEEGEAWEATCSF